MAPDFEYDPYMSLINKAKHGIDFEAAKALWLDRRLLEAPARTTDEPRWLAVGLLAGKPWTVVFNPARRDDPFDFGQMRARRGDRSL